MIRLVLILIAVSLLNACGSISTNSSSDDPELSNQYTAGQDNASKIAKINVQLGAGYISNGRYDRALIKLKKAIKEDNDYALAHNYLGVLYGRLGKIDKARKEFKHSISLSPGDSQMYNNYAIFLCEQKKYSEAQKMFTKVINNPLYIKRAEAYQAAAWCAFEDNKLEMSEQLYRKSLKLDPTLPNSLLGLAKLNYKNKNYEYSWSYFQRYYQGTAPNADALWLAINILYKIDYPDQNKLSSFELQLKSRYPDSNQAKKLFEGIREY